MGLLKQLEAVRKGVKTATIETKVLGPVTLMSLFTSHRLEFHREASKTRDPLLLMVAMSICEGGQRLVDSLDVDEVLALIDPLGGTEQGLEDIKTLYEAASDLAKVGVNDVEEAAKN